MIIACIVVVFSKYEQDGSIMNSVSTTTLPENDLPSSSIEITFTVGANLAQEPFWLKPFLSNNTLLSRVLRFLFVVFVLTTACSDGRSQGMELHQSPRRVVTGDPGTAPTSIQVASRSAKRQPLFRRHHQQQTAKVDVGATEGSVPTPRWPRHMRKWRDCRRPSTRWEISEAPKSMPSRDL